MAEQQQEPAPSLLLRRRWLRWGIGVIVTLLILLTLLPEAVRYAAVHVLQNQGVQQVEIEDVDLNLFTGTVALTGVSISGDGNSRATLAHLYLNLAMTALLNKRIELQRAALDGLELDVGQDEQGEWRIAGIFPPPPAAEQAPTIEPPATPWGIGIRQLQLNGITVQLSMPKLQSDLHVDSLQLKRLASWQPQQAAAYQAQLHINETPLQINGEMRPFAETPHFAGRLELTQLPLALAREFARDADVERLQGELSVTSEFDARIAAGGPTVKSQTEIVFSGLDFKQGRYAMQADRFSWAGEINYLPPAGEQDLGVRVNGAVALQQFNLHDHQADLDLARLERLQIDNIALTEAQQLNVERMAFDRLSVLRSETQQLASLANINVTGVMFDGQRALAISEVVLNGLAANVLRKADGRIAMVDQLQADSSASVPQQETAEADAPDTDERESPPFRFQLTRLHIADDSRVLFKDESVTPPFDAEIKPLSLTVANVDTANTEQTVEVDLHGVINNHEEITVTADIKPFGEKLNMQADGKIAALDLPPLSPYANQAMGYYLKRGRLNSTMTMTVKQDRLKAEIHAVLNKFNIEEGDPAKHKGFSEKLSMPLDAALDLLRDENDDIKLDVSVDGDINDPQFDAGKVINKALANATKTAVTTYVKFMLQPWGAMLIAAEMLGESGVSLEPLTFSPTETAITSEQQKYLDKIAKLLQERPEISLTICGLASEQDRAALRAAQEVEQKSTKTTGDDSGQEVTIANTQLLKLATERGAQVKQQLIERGVAAGRLFNCHPGMDDADTNLPQVKLTL